jgi:hypothetical protein
LSEHVAQARHTCPVRHQVWHVERRQRFPIVLERNELPHDMNLLATCMASKANGPARTMTEPGRLQARA